MNIKLSDVPAEGRMYAGEDPGSIFDLDSADGFEKSGDVAYRLQAVHIPGTLYVTGELEAKVQFRCCRCHESFVTAVCERDFSSSWELSEDGSFGPARMDEDPQVSPITPHGSAAEADRDSPKDPESVDLTPDIRESMILAFPHYPVCSQRCKGLCGRCGINLNREACDCAAPNDDRWAQLDMLEVREDSDGRT
jgi:uncharacterized protein